MRDGKILSIAMQKLITRYGCMLLCGWSPPASPTDWGFNVEPSDVGRYIEATPASLLAARKLPLGVPTLTDKGYQGAGVWVHCPVKAATSTPTRPATTHC